MTDDGILYLVVFIILPTAIVVSGFWLLFLVWRNRRPQPEAEQSADEVVMDEDVTAEQPAVDDEPELEEEVVVAERQLDDAAEEQEPASVVEEPVIEEAEADIPTEVEPSGAPEPVEEIDSVAADLLAQEHEPELDAVDELAPLPDDLAAHTEEIPDVSGAPFEPARLKAADDSEWRPMPAIEPEPEPEPTADETEVETEREEDVEDQPEPEPGAEEAPTEEEEQQPSSRLLPGAHSQPRPARRGRHTGRHVPRLRRSRRDEGSVEGGDGPGGVGV